jgi:hypothetical protein
MSGLEVVALVTGGLAIARQLAGLAFFVRYLRRASVRRLPTGGPTPPLSIVQRVDGDEPALEENLTAALRQNYPDFELVVVHEGGPVDAVERARKAVPDVEVKTTAGDPGPVARHECRVLCDPRVRPDPLFLRDAASGLAEADIIPFVPVLFGARSLPARLAALTVNTDLFLTMVLGRGTIPSPVTMAIRRDGSRIGLARRPARVHAPTGQWADARPGLGRLSSACSAAPLLLLLAGLWWPLALLVLLRLLVAFAVDFRFCWDRSLLKSFPLLPLLWILEPLGFLAALLGAGRRARLMGS